MAGNLEGQKALGIYPVGPGRGAAATIKIIIGGDQIFIIQARVHPMNLAYREFISTENQAESIGEQFLISFLFAGILIYPDSGREEFIEVQANQVAWHDSFGGLLAHSLISPVPKRNLPFRYQRREPSGYSMAGPSSR